jgi:hypothetical protein
MGGVANRTTMKFMHRFNIVIIRNPPKKKAQYACAFITTSKSGRTKICPKLLAKRSFYITLVEKLMMICVVKLDHSILKDGYLISLKR